MAVLATVANYLTTARVLLQDTVTPYRYSDAELTIGLDLAIAESARLRPDMWATELRTNTLPAYSGMSTATAVAIDQRYRSAFLYYIVGHAQMRDDEGEQDTRAAALLNKFVSQLLAVAA